MAAEYDDLPDAVKTEVQTFADINVAWLTRMLAAASLMRVDMRERARAIFAAVGGAQLMARSRAGPGTFRRADRKLSQVWPTPELKVLQTGHQ